MLKRFMPKRKKKKQKSQKTNFLKVFLLILLFSFISVILSYFIINNKEKTKKEITKTHIKNKTKVNENEFTFEKIMNKKKKEVKEEYTPKNNEIKFEEELQEEQTHIKKEIKDTSTKEKIAKKDLYKFDKKTKPKIAIIIDDVSSSKQKKQILNIGYKVGMAFLPPTKNHKNSAKIAQDLPFYIIHFPMQASPKFKGEEENTLKITDSYERIEKRVQQLRSWYPKATFTNNHTGSVFTKNDEAMDKLFKALKKYNFTFIDSKTSPKSVAKKYALKYDMPYIVRNTFLDNKKEYAYIQNQLKKAISKAKNDGYSIAIGHPHSMTLKVLKESKHLLKGLELIYVNQLPYLQN